MTNRELKKKLSALSALKVSGEPSALWVAQSRALLMEKIRGEAADPVARNIELPIRMPRTGINKFMFALRPVMAVFVFAGFGAFGWLASVSASFGAIPGDPLYALKTATERAQLTFTTDPSARAMLHLEFLGRRANEVASIAESADVGRGDSVSLAVDELQQELKSVSSTLDEVQSGGSLQNAASVAQAVDRKVAELRTVLNKTKNRLDSVALKKVTDLESSADDVSLKAVAVLVQTAKQGVGPETTDVATRVQEKIDDAEQNVIAASPEVSDQVKAALKEAKDAFAKDDLEGAVTKVQESAELANQDAAATVETAANTNVNAPSNDNVNGKIKAIDVQ
jgi:hypothetical protein